MTRTIYAFLGLVLVVVGCRSPAKTTPSAEQRPSSPSPRIAMFYVTPNALLDGQSAQLCYSVEDTAKVTLDPPVDRVWPAISHCLEIKPARTTTYTLTAENAAGEKVTATTQATIRPPQVKIIDVSVGPLEIRAGQGFPFCVHARNASNWKLSSGEWAKPPDAGGGCVVDHPMKTTTYIVTAIGAAGDTDSTRVTATVK